jgi:hypothetical protein
MGERLFSRILASFVAAAYLGAAMLQAAPSFATHTHNQAAIGGMVHDQDHPSEPMPCQGKMRGCVSDLGCIFLVSLPAPDLTLVAVTAWSSVSYDNAFQGLRGRTIKPALGPPIPLA